MSGPLLHQGWLCYPRVAAPEQRIPGPQFARNQGPWFLGGPLGPLSPWDTPACGSGSTGQRSLQPSSQAGFFQPGWRRPGAPPNDPPPPHTFLFFLAYSGTRGWSGERKTKESAWYPAVGCAVTWEPLAISWKITLIKSDAPGPGEGRRHQLANGTKLQGVSWVLTPARIWAPLLLLPVAWGWEEGPDPKTPDSVPAEHCGCRLPGAARGPGVRPVPPCVCPASTPSCVLISFPFLAEFTTSPMSNPPLFST